MAPTGDSSGSPPTQPAPDGASSPRRGRSVTGIVFLSLGGLVALFIAITVLVLLTPQAQRTQDVVQALVEPAPLPPREHGVRDAEILLGMAGPFSGANRELGRGMRLGLEAAFAELNAQGGVHGRQLRLVAVDDGYEPSRTGPALRELVEKQEVFAVVGNVGTPTAAVAVPYCAARKVLYFGAYSGGDLLRRDPPDRYVFNYRASYAEEAAAAVRFLVDLRRVDPRRVAVFGQEDELGASGFRAVARELARRGVAEEGILRVGYRRNSADVEGAVAALRARAAEVDAVVMIATYKPAATFIRRLRDEGLAVMTTNVSAAEPRALAQELVTAGARYTRDVVVTQVVPPPTSPLPGVERYERALARHAPGEPLGCVTLEGWLVGRLLAEGLRRAGRDLDTERLVEALEGMRELDLGLGTRLGFSPEDHQASHTVWVTQLQADGSYRQIAGR